MYFGITFGKGRDCFTADTSNLMILVPEGSDFDAATLFEAFRSEKVERTDEKLCAILERTVSQENEALHFFIQARLRRIHSTFSENLLSVSFQPKK